jgi:hypothetical protein
MTKDRVHVTGHALKRWRERIGHGDAAAVERSFRRASMVRLAEEVGFLTNRAEFVNAVDRVRFGVDYSKINRCAIIRTVMALERLAYSEKARP